MAKWQYISAEEGDALVQLGANVWYRTKQGRGYVWLKKRDWTSSLVNKAAMIAHHVSLGFSMYRNNKNALVPESLEVRVEVDG